jgi:hypothetical protein
MEKPSTEQKPYRYPWARALMIVVLYGALLVFLWHFPTSGGRAFFQTLFRGLLYVLAGLGLVGVTAIFFLFFPIPPAPLPRMVETYNEDEDDDDFQAAVVPVRSLMVPAFKTAAAESRIWEILYTLNRDYEFDYDIMADSSTGVISVVDEDEEAATFILDEIRATLKAAGIAVRTPR